MLRVLSSIAICTAVAAIPALSGCEHKTTEETTVRKSDGTVKQEKKEVTRDSDGNVTSEKTTERTNK